jgi:hypothetical protein
MDKGLLYLYNKFDKLYEDIKPICLTCNDHDCEGFIWLLEEEVDLLYNKNIPIVEVNKNINFIHSFDERNGLPIIDQIRPPCKLRKNGICSIYQFRPLACRMYPIGPAAFDGVIYLALYNNCKFSRNLLKTERSQFYKKVLSILSNASTKILQSFYKTYEAVDKISTYPDGLNSVEIISPLNSIIKKGRQRCLNVSHN